MPENQRTADGLPQNFSWVLQDTLGEFITEFTLNYHMSYDMLVLSSWLCCTSIRGGITVSR